MLSETERIGGRGFSFNCEDAVALEQHFGANPSLHVKHLVLDGKLLTYWPIILGFVSSAWKPGPIV